MRGTIAVAMLAELEAMIGKPAYDLFDMVVGNSTGAVIAAGLGIHLSAQDILEQIYKDRLPRSFPEKNLLLWLRYVLGGLRYLYPPEPFQRALEPYVRAKKVRDLKDPIVMMTAKDMRTSNTYYVVSSGPGEKAFGDWPISGAVAASASAPIYFPAVAGNVIDGGVGVFANPCLAAAVEAIEYIQFMEENTTLVSLGTGYVSTEIAEGLGARFWLKDWIGYLILEALDDAALQQVYSTRYLQAPRPAPPNPNLTRESVEKKLGVSLGSVSLDRLGYDPTRSEEIALMEQIGRFTPASWTGRSPTSCPGRPSAGIPNRASCRSTGRGRRINETVRAPRN
jgi:hypothetical protein